MMMDKSEIKKAIKKAYHIFKHTRQRAYYYRCVEKQISNSKEEIPDLTVRQQADIRQYWSQYGIDVPLQWHRLLYGKTGLEDPRFIPEITFQRVIKPCMNELGFAKVWGDKSYLDYFLRDVKTVRSVIRNVNGRFLSEQFWLISMKEAQSILEQYDTLVIKPSTDTDTGKGVMLMHRPYDMKALHNTYRKNYVVQLPVQQHEQLKKLNASSVNTIRVNSVLFDDKAHVMSAFVKVGQTGEFADNHGHDRFFIGIGMDGTFGDYAIDHDLNKYDMIPSGYAFAGEKVACFDKICRAVENAHECIPHFGFAFWDVALDESGEPVIVEANLRYPDTTIPQVAGGPFFGEYTEEIMDYIKNLTGGGTNLLTVYIAVIPFKKMVQQPLLRREAA